MRQCLDLYVSLVCRLHREYIVAFFSSFLLSSFFGGRGCWFLFLSFCFVFFSFCSCLFLFFVSLFLFVLFFGLFVLSVCLVLFVNCFL